MAKKKKAKKKAKKRPKPVSQKKVAEILDEAAEVIPEDELPPPIDDFDDSDYTY